MMALEEFKAINLVLPVSVECHKEFQKETKIASPELQAVLLVLEKWMARHKSTSSCRGKTVLDILR